MSVAVLSSQQAQVTLQVGSLKWWAHHSDVLSSLWQVALNTAVLAAKYFQSIPDRVAYGAQLLMSYRGVIGLPSQVIWLKKTGEDVGEAWRGKDGVGTVATVLATTSQMADLALTVGAFAAHALSFIGQRLLALSLYSWMAPIGIASLCVSAALDVWRYHDIKQLVGELERAEDGKTQELFQRLRPKIARQFGPQAWTAIKKGIESRDVEELRLCRQDLLKHCREKRTIATQRIGLRILGYLSLGFCKAYYETLQEKLVLWLYSLTYTCFLVYDKWVDAKAAKQR